MPKLVISNATPIINLLKIGQLDILKKLYGRITVPSYVFREIEEGKKKEFYIDLKSVEWIDIIELKNKEILEFLIDLDAGEAETIALAKELKSDLTIIDEKLGRRIAQNFELKITGTLGVLMRAKEKGMISDLKSLFYELKEKGTFINDKLIDELLSNL